MDIGNEWDEETRIDASSSSLLILAHPLSGNFLLSPVFNCFRNSTWPLTIQEHTACVTTKIRVHCRLNGKNWWIQERLQSCALIQLPKIMVIEIISKGTSVRFARDLMNQRLNRPVVKSTKIFQHEEAGKGIPHSG